MFEVILQSAEAASDFLALRAEPFDEHADSYYQGPDVIVELSCRELHATAVLPAWVADAERLAPLFHEIDRDWRGWTGEKKAGMPDQDWLSFSATHDGRGHVALTVHLADGWPAEASWSVEATLPVDVGSAARVAAALDHWLAVVWPPPHRWRSPT